MELPPPFPRYLLTLRTLSRRLQRHNSSELNGRKTLASRLSDVFLRTWHLGLTSFGGLAVNLQTLHAKFVEGKGGQERWVDEQTYQELSAVCQALPGPASTKMLFCITLLHAGFIPALMAFFLWCLPGFIGMYALSIGVQNMDYILPQPAYALLSGLNASTVGIVALSAVQLADRAIRDRLTRLLVIFGACAGLCYNALWYFPVLMIAGGLVTVTWDGWMSQLLRKAKSKWRQRTTHPEDAHGEGAADTAVVLQEQGCSRLHISSARAETVRPRRMCQATETFLQDRLDSEGLPQADSSQNHIIKIRIGILLCAIFFVSFVGVIVTRGLIKQPPLTLDLFANMYLAGTIIFGGGPVVIPLLRSYVVDPGWVSGRDFLIGLALIQAFPGPNFNFAVFLGSLAISRSQFASIYGAFLGAFGIYLPGIVLAVSVQSFWRVLRKRKWVVDLLRGINATAVGLVFTAVYRLWEVGYLTPDDSNGQSLAKEPWWVVVAAIAYAGNAWFKVPPAFAIISGAVLGLCWYAAVGR
ncbi:putative chromate ion transporter [Aspergillus varians]